MKSVRPDVARQGLVAADKKENAALAANLLKRASARRALRIVIVSEDQGGAGGERSRNEARVGAARAIGREGERKRRLNACRRIEGARGSC